MHHAVLRSPAGAINIVPHTLIYDGIRWQDVEWNAQVEVVVIPNPCLTPGQQAIIAMDYAMRDGQLRFTQRIPRVHYALDRMQVSYDGQHNQNPDQFSLVLKNRDALITQGCKFKLATPV